MRRRILLVVLAAACSASDQAAESAPAQLDASPAAPPAAAEPAAAAAEATSAAMMAAPPAAEEELPPGCRWVETEYRDEVSLTTCNSVAHIKVRFMSFGPGFCAVEARSGVQGDVVGITAPPAVWTGWTDMPVAHLGVVSRTIKNTVHCDTGVRSQVRYSATQ